MPDKQLREGDQILLPEDLFPLLASHVELHLAPAQFVLPRIYKI